jgi:hypothetical protein
VVRRRPFRGFRTLRQSLLVCEFCKRYALDRTRVRWPSRIVWSSVVHSVTYSDAWACDQCAAKWAPRRFRFGHSPPSPPAPVDGNGWDYYGMPTA